MGEPSATIGSIGILGTSVLSRAVKVLPSVHPDLPRFVKAFSVVNRPMRFHSLVLKNLMRRRFRSILTLVAFATAIAAVVSLLGIAKGFQNSFVQVYRSHSVDIVVTRQGASDRLSSSLDAALAGRIGDVDGVGRFAPVLLETLSLEAQAVYGIPSMGIPGDSWMFGDYDITAQTVSSDAFRLEPKSLLLGKNLASRVDVKVGDAVELFDDPYRVAGVFSSGSTWENGSMILTLEDLQSLSGRDGQITYVNVVAPANASAVVQAIGALDSKLLAMPTEDFVASDARMQIAEAMAWMTSMIAILIGAIGTLNTMMTSVIERTGEIGILRAVGWSRRRVVTMIVAESVVLATIGTIAGCVLAIGLTSVLSRSPAVKGIIEASIDPRVMIQGALIGLAIGLLGAILPAARASKLLPMDAFRNLG